MLPEDTDSKRSTDSSENVSTAGSNRPCRTRRACLPEIKEIGTPSFIHLAASPDSQSTGTTQGTTPQFDHWTSDTTEDRSIGDSSEYQSISDASEARESADPFVPTSERLNSPAIFYALLEATFQHLLDAYTAILLWSIGTLPHLMDAYTVILFWLIGTVQHLMNTYTVMLSWVIRYNWRLVPLILLALCFLLSWIGDMTYNESAKHVTRSIVCRTSLFKSLDSCTFIVPSTLTFEPSTPILEEDIHHVEAARQAAAYQAAAYPTVVHQAAAQQTISLQDAAHQAVFLVKNLAITSELFIISRQLQDVHDKLFLFNLKADDPGLKHLSDNFLRHSKVLRTEFRGFLANVTMEIQWIDLHTTTFARR